MFTFFLELLAPKADIPRFNFGDGAPGLGTSKDQRPFDTIPWDATKYYYYRRYNEKGELVEYNDYPHTQDEIRALRLYYNDEVRQTNLSDWQKVQDVLAFEKMAVNDIERK